MSTRQTTKLDPVAMAYTIPCWFSYTREFRVERDSASPRPNWPLEFKPYEKSSPFLFLTIPKSFPMEISSINVGLGEAILSGAR